VLSCSAKLESVDPEVAQLDLKILTVNRNASMPERLRVVSVE
jgi:hypothetical protein